MKEVPRHRLDRAIRIASSAIGALLLATALSSCAKNNEQKTAEGDVVTVSGYAVHYRIEVANGTLNPLGYTITLRNDGLKPITFKPQPPGLNLVLDPKAFTENIFVKNDNSSGFNADQSGAITLQSGNTCTVPLAITDLESGLRGSVHDCQIEIRPQSPTASTSTTGPQSAPAEEERIRSKTFRISVP